MGLAPHAVPEYGVTEAPNRKLKSLSDDLSRVLSENFAHFHPVVAPFSDAV
jgi:hypothetical protein